MSGGKNEKIQQIMRSFREVNRVLYQPFREAAEHYDTTAIQMLVLRILARNNGMKLGELADQMQMGNSTMSGVVDRLVKAGLIVRERSKQDRRSLVMRLTEKGRKKEKEIFDENSLLLQKLSPLNEIPEKDLHALLRIHKDIARKLQEK